MGSLLDPRDSERIYCDWIGVEFNDRRKSLDFDSDWEEFEYKPIRSSPLEWFKQQILGKD